MIKNTLDKTKKSTFYISTPSNALNEKGMPRPSGTGFFISPTGYCITACHVLYQINEHGMAVLGDDNLPKLIEGKDVWLENENSMLIQGVQIVKHWPQFDIVLMKVDINDLKQKEYFKNKENFDYVDIEFDLVPEGENVYSFGYPLSTADVRVSPGMIVGTTNISPRVTSSIISSHHKSIGPIRTPNDPKFYVLDKALNYGNSGGPIIVEESGKVISVCTEFQPVFIPQQTGYIMTPSLYGITSSLKNIQDDLGQVLQ